MANLNDEMQALGLIDEDLTDAAINPDPVERQATIERVEQEQGFRTLKAQEIIRDRKLAFLRLFRDGMATKDDVKIVMSVLDVFCRYRTTTFHADARLHAVAEGRREVRLLIDDYIELSVDELYNKLV